MQHNKKVWNCVYASFAVVGKVQLMLKSKLQEWLWHMKSKRFSAVLPVASALRYRWNHRGATGVIHCHCRCSNSQCASILSASLKKQASQRSAWRCFFETSQHKSIYSPGASGYIKIWCFNLAGILLFNSELELVVGNYWVHNHRQWVSSCS